MVAMAIVNNILRTRFARELNNFRLMLTANTFMCLLLQIN